MRISQDVIFNLSQTERVSQNSPRAPYAECTPGSRVLLGVDSLNIDEVCIYSLDSMSPQCRHCTPLWCPRYNLGFIPRPPHVVANDCRATAAAAVYSGGWCARPRDRRTRARAHHGASRPHPARQVARSRIAGLSVRSARSYTLPAPRAAWSEHSALLARSAPC